MYPWSRRKFGRGAPDRRFVFDQQNRLRSPQFVLRFGLFDLAQVMPLVHAGQIDFEDGAGPRLAIDPYEAIILFHDPINRRQSKTGALARGLGRIKGLKNMR